MKTYQHSNKNYGFNTKYSTNKLRSLCSKGITSMLFLAISSCTQESNALNPIGATPNTKDYIAFGQFYGYCVGKNCIAIFRVYQNELFEDTLDTYPVANKDFSVKLIKRPEADFQLAKNIRSLIPNQLLDVKDPRIGLPDATDGGGIYIELFENGTRKYWFIDNFKENIPEYLHPMMDSVHKKLQVLVQ
jgi:hypothetical protein